MSGQPRRQGPALHRFGVLFFGALLALLLIWLLGFVLDDIGRTPGPDYREIEERHVAAADRDALDEARRSLDEVRLQIEDQRQVQEILRASTDNSRATMDQLLEIHRLGLERGVNRSPEEQAAMAESQRLFLETQQKFQQANDAIADLNRRKQDLQREIRALEERIDESRQPARDEYDRLRRGHQLRVAAFKLLFLVPLFLASAWLVLRKRESPYRPIFYAALIATSWKVGAVMHEHFPTELFKYVVIGVSILVVLAAILKLIRMMTAPQRDWLLKQYREAYHRQRCPICADPIRRGPLKHARWTRKGPVVGGPASAGREAGPPEEPYSCPACGTRLFEPCPQCQAVRHALLPYCESCGAQKPVATAATTP